MKKLCTIILIVFKHFSPPSLQISSPLVLAIMSCRVLGVLVTRSSCCSHHHQKILHQHGPSSLARCFATTGSSWSKKKVGASYLHVAYVNMYRVTNKSECHENHGQLHNNVSSYSRHLISSSYSFIWSSCTKQWNFYKFTTCQIQKCFSNGQRRSCSAKIINQEPRRIFCFVFFFFCFSDVVVLQKNFVPLFRAVFVFEWMLLLDFFIFLCISLFHTNAERGWMTMMLLVDHHMPEFAHG